MSKVDLSKSHKDRRPQAKIGATVKVGTDEYDDSGNIVPGGEYCSGTTVSIDGDEIVVRIADEDVAQSIPERTVKAAWCASVGLWVDINTEEEFFRID